LLSVLQTAVNEGNGLETILLIAK